MLAPCTPGPTIASPQGTLPTWDFGGGSKAAATTGRHAAALGTLGRDPRSLTGGSTGSATGSFTAGQQGGGGSFTGTVRAAVGAGGVQAGTGTVARADGWALQQHGGGTAGQEATLPAGAAADGTPGPSGGSGGGGGSGDGGSRAVYKRLPSLQALSVDVGHVPGGGVAAGLPQGSGAGPEVTILRRFSRHESAAAAAEGDATLGRLLLPALRALGTLPGGPDQVRAPRTWFASP